MNIPFEKIPDYKNAGVRNRDFYGFKKAKYGWISHNLVSREPHIVESGFMVQIMQNINILTDSRYRISKTSQCG